MRLYTKPMKSLLKTRNNKFYHDQNDGLFEIIIAYEAQNTRLYHTKQILL